MRFLPASLLLLAAPAFAEPPIVAATAFDPASGIISVDLLATNGGAEAERLAVEPTLDATIEDAAGTHIAIRLERAAEQLAEVTLPPAGFARLHYRLVVPASVASGPLTLSLSGAPAVAIAYGGQPRQASAASTAPPPSFAEPALSATGSRGASGFLPNLSTYEPIYAVFGPGTDTDMRLQVSLKYQLFGTPGQRSSWLDGLTFGYTQQMFWDLGRASAPFRDVNYMPELYYALPPLGSIGDWTVSGRFGVRHQSNGRSGAASRSFNIAYVEPQFTTRLGSTDVAFGPRAWAYIGRRSDNPRIAHYRGNAGLFARIGSPEGVQLDASGRLNPGSRKGAAEALVSYPLTRLFRSGPKLYLFGQGFAGYGEDLLDYDRRQTRLRAGIGIVR